jgi:hypothetical protein
MLTASMGWILIVSGAVASIGGIVVFLFPRPILELGFGTKSDDGVVISLVRHWGVMVVVLYTLTVYCGYVPATRPPIMIAAIVDKLGMIGLFLFGPMKRTIALTGLVITDGILSVLFLAYLVG